MTNHPFPAISNPQTTTTGQYSGDVIINLRNLVTDIDLSPLFESWRPIIKTQFLFRSGKIAMTDPDLTNEISIAVADFDNIDGNFVLTIPSVTEDDTFALLNTPQIFDSKVLTNSALGSDFSIEGFTLNELGALKIKDKNADNIPLIGISGTAPNTHFDFLSGYKSLNFPNISAATDLTVTYGYDSQLTKYEWYFGTTPRVQLTDTELKIMTDTVNFDTATITNLVLDKTNLPAVTVYTDQANNYGAFNQTFRSAYFSLYDSDQSHRYIFNTGNLTSSNIALSIPALTANDTFAFLATANVFINKQKIQWNGTSDQLTLYKGNSPAIINNYAGLQFSALNSAASEIVYATVLAGTGDQAADIVAGTEKGQMALQIRESGALATKIQIRSTALYTYGMLPRIQVGSSDLYSMYIYRPINSSGSNLINFQLQDIASAQKSFGYIGVRSETVTAGAEVGSVQFGAVVSGTLQLLGKLQNYQTFLYNSSGFAATLDPTGLSASRIFTFPNVAGEITVNGATQTLLNKTVSTGWTITGDVAVNNSLGLHITKNAGASTAEVLMRLDMADAASSYFQVDNATTTDGQFVPRITTYNAGSGASTPGLYLYSNILGANDTGSTNGVIVLDGRRVENAALTSRPILDIRNFATNIFRITPTQVQNLLPVIIQPVSGTGDFETFLTLQPSDAPSCSMTISNGTSTNTVFTPLISSSALAAAAASTHVPIHLRNIILAANDTGTTPMMVIEGRHSDSTSVTTRPLLGIRNLNTDQYLFYPNYFDLGAHYMDIKEVAVPSNPAADTLRIYNDSADGLLKIRDSAGTVTTIGSGGATLIDQLLDVDTTTAAPTNNQVLTWNSTSSQWVPATPPGASGGEANLGANVGTGTGLLFRDKTGVTLNFKSLLAGNGISLTNNANDVTVAIGSTITLPSAVGSLFTFTKPNSGATGAERMVRFIVDDDPNGSELTIENMTGNQNVFSPGLIFSQYSSATIPSAIILGRVATANDVVNTTPAISLNARQPTAALVNRPLFGIQNYTDAYDFMVYKDKIDFGGNSLQNAVVASSFTGIVDANIDPHTTTKITIASKTLLPSSIAYEDELNVFTSQQVFRADQFDPILIRRPIGTNGSTAGIHFQLQDSLANNQSYARIEARIGSNTDTSETGYLDFYTMKNGTLGQYMILDGNQLSLGLSGQRVILDATGITTTSKTFTFPNLSGQLVTQEFANVFSAAQKISVNSASPLVLYKPVNTAFTQWGVDFNANDSASAEATYAKIWVSLEDNTAGSKDSYIGFSYQIGNSIQRRAAFSGNSLLLGTSGTQAVLNPTGLSADRTFTFPNATSLLFGDGVDNDLLAHFLDIGEIAAPATPSANKLRIYMDSADEILRTKNSSGIAYNLMSTRASKTANYTIVDSDDVIEVDATGVGDITITLPAAANRNGKRFTVMKTNSTGGNAIIDGNLSETINGALTFTLTAQYQSVTLVCDGSNWRVMGLSNERRGKTTASGNGSATVFNVPHGLGVTPHSVLLQCSSHNIGHTRTYDATNIVVTFASAPPSGTNNVIFEWSAVQ